MSCDISFILLQALETVVVIPHKIFFTVSLMMGQVVSVGRDAFVQGPSCIFNDW